MPITKIHLRKLKINRIDDEIVAILWNFKMLKS